MKTTVYLASSMGNPIYRDSVEAFGDWMAQKGYDLVYGGSQTGLMGLLADRVLAHGGKVYGIMPDFLQKREEVHQGLTQLRIVADMDERKRLLMEMGDVLVAFPGGPGTLEEISQAISWARVGQHDKPCLLFNANGYYDSLKIQFDQMVSAGFLTTADRDKVLFVDSLQALEEVISSYQK